MVASAALMIGISTGFVAAWSFFRLIWLLYIAATFGLFLGSLVFQFVLWGVVGTVAAIASFALLTRYPQRILTLTPREPQVVPSLPRLGTTSFLCEKTSCPSRICENSYAVCVIPLPVLPSAEPNVPVTVAGQLPHRQFTDPVLLGEGGQLLGVGEAEDLAWVRR